MLKWIWQKEKHCFALYFIFLVGGDIFLFAFFITLFAIHFLFNIYEKKFPYNWYFFLQIVWDLLRFWTNSILRLSTEIEFQEISPILKKSS